MLASSLCSNPERQRARIALAVFHLFLPAHLSQSGRVGDLPIMELAVGQELYAPRTDAAQCDPALAGLGRDDFCHGRHLSAFSNRTWIDNDQIEFPFIDQSIQQVRSHYKHCPVRISHLGKKPVQKA